MPFTRTFEGKEQIPREELDARLSTPGELSGVLNKAIAALRDIRAYGLTRSPSLEAAFLNFRRATDPVAVWLDTATVECPDGFVLKHSLLTAYNEAAAQARRPTMTATAFGRALDRVRP